MVRVNSLRVMLPLAILGLALFRATGYAQDDAVKKELKALEGTWVVQKHIKEGKESLPKEVITLILTGNEYKVQVDGEDRATSTYAIDVTKTPRGVDFLFVNFTGAHRLTGKKTLAIYELKGDELKVAFGGLDEDRPIDFSGKVHTVNIYKKGK